MDFETPSPRQKLHNRMKQFVEAPTPANRIALLSYWSDETKFLDCSPLGIGKCTGCPMRDVNGDSMCYYKQAFLYNSASDATLHMLVLEALSEWVDKGKSSGEAI